ncbi:MAG: metallophosphoesterase [Alphaproteobacteria bacterium]|nr:metallophosphoesterase [Alphaproteobacteria bacterium]
MAIVFVLVAILQVLAGYFCAKVVQYVTKKAWLGVLAMLFTIVPVMSIYLKKSLGHCEWFTNGFCYLGYVYLGFILYFPMYCAVAFVFRKFYKKVRLKKLLSAGFVLIPILLLGGYLNAINPRLKTINIESNYRNVGESSDLKICFVSDIHVGCINTKHIFNRVVDCINRANPDVVIFGGDVLDIEALKVYEKTFVDIMRDKITSKYDTYTVIGNHEIYAGVEDCVRLLKKAGVKILIDKVVEVKGVSIAGRLDRTVRSRKSLSQILSGNEKNLIVVDHTPSAIEESAKHGALLHLSGHTHGGQTFPMNLLVNYLFGPTGDLRKVQNTHAYITYGAGFWGPPYRIGNVPEVVLIKISRHR